MPKYGCGTSMCFYREKSVSSSLLTCSPRPWIREAFWLWLDLLVNTVSPFPNRKYRGSHWLRMLFASECLVHLCCLQYVHLKLWNIVGWRTNTVHIDSQSEWVIKYKHLYFTAWIWAAFVSLSCTAHIIRISSETLRWWQTWLT